MDRSRGASYLIAQEEFSDGTSAEDARFWALFVVTTDASLVLVVTIFEQGFGQGLQPVVFESQKLNPGETRYSVYKRELLGIVWAIGKWRYYFEGRKFIVQIDHSFLCHLPNQPSVNHKI